MEQTPPWEANCCWSSQEILCPLQNLKLHYHIHKSFPLVPVLSHLNPHHAFPPHFPMIHSSIFSSVPRFSISHLFHVCYMHHPSHPPYLITLIMFGEEHKLWSSLCNFPQLLCCILPLRSGYSSQHPVLKHKLCSSHNVRDQVSYPYKIRGTAILLWL